MDGITFAVGNFYQCPKEKFDFWQSNHLCLNNQHQSHVLAIIPMLSKMYQYEHTYRMILA